MATCPECDAEVEVDDDDLEEMEAGDPWDCEACGSSLRVVSLDPMEFESDDEDDEDEEDEEAKDEKEADPDADADDVDDEDEPGDDKEWDE